MKTPCVAVTAPSAAVPDPELTRRARQVLKGLTKPQSSAVVIMSAAAVTWSPGEIPRNNVGQVRKVTLRRLKSMGVTESYGLHEWGPHPVYASKLTDDLGREIARLIAEGAGCAK